MRVTRRVFVALLVGVVASSTAAPALGASTEVNGLVVFSSNRDGNSEIYVMRQDGSNQTRLTNNAFGDFDPVWSADGSKIAFVRSTGGNPDIYVMNADGSGEVRLTDDPSIDLDPSWSPDGTKILFDSNRTPGGL